MCSLSPKPPQTVFRQWLDKSGVSESNIANALGSMMQELAAFIVGQRDLCVRVAYVLKERFNCPARPGYSKRAYSHHSTCLCR